jgi:hypothetical protein
VRSSVKSAQVGANADRQGVETAGVVVDRSVHRPAKRKRKFILGAKHCAVPQNVRELMGSSTAEGASPVTTLKQRQQVMRGLKMAAVVPERFTSAWLHFYIHPNLPPPAGHRWVAQNALAWRWRLQAVPQA